MKKLLLLFLIVLTAGCSVKNDFEVKKDLNEEIKLGASTFGYTTAGSSCNDSTLAPNTLIGSVFTSPADMGTLTKVSAYVSMAPVATNMKVVIVNHSDLTIVENGVSNTVTDQQQTGKWEDFTFATAPTLSPSTDYVLMWIYSSALDPTVIACIKYNSGDTNQGHVDTSNSYSSPTDPTDASHDNNKYSIYVTYEPAVTATPPEGGTELKSGNIQLKSGDLIIK